jgi:hypothetical protein
VYGKTLEGGSRDIYTKVKPINIKLAEEGRFAFLQNLERTNIACSYLPSWA